MKIGKTYEVKVDDSKGLVAGTQIMEVDSFQTYKEDDIRVHAKILDKNEWHDGFFYLSEILTFKEVEKPKLKPVYEDGDTYKGTHYTYERINGQWYIQTKLTDETIENTKDPAKEPGSRGPHVQATPYAINVFTEGEQPKELAPEILDALDRGGLLKKTVRRA